LSRQLFKHGMWKIVCLAWFLLKHYDIRHCLSLEYNRLMVSAAVPRTTRTSRQFMTRAKSSQLNSNHATSATFPASTDNPFAMWYHHFKQFTRKASVRAWMRKNISEISVSYLMVLYTVFLNFTSIQSKIKFLVLPIGAISQEGIFNSLYAPNFCDIFFFIQISIFLIFFMDLAGSFTNQVMHENQISSRTKKSTFFGAFSIYFICIATSTFFAMPIYNHLSQKVIPYFLSNNFTPESSQAIFENVKGYSFATTMGFILSLGYCFSIGLYFLATCRPYDTFPSTFKSAAFLQILSLIFYLSKSPLAIYANFILLLSIFIYFTSVSQNIVEMNTVKYIRQIVCLLLTLVTLAVDLIYGFITYQIYSSRPFALNINEAKSRHEILNFVILLMMNSAFIYASSKSDSIETKQKPKKK